MSACIGKKCVSRFREEECGPEAGCAGRRILADLAKGEKYLPMCAGPPTDNRYGNMLAKLGYAEGAWPTRITDAGIAFLAGCDPLPAPATPQEETPCR